MKKTIFIKNAAILTASSLLLRFVGIFFKVWLAAKINAEGIGLYQLVFSVYMFAATFATSGICTAVTRLISEELVIGSKGGIRRILSRCIMLSVGISIITISLLYFGGDFIAKNILRDTRAALSLKILGFSLPFMSVCSCIKGYFMARRKAAPSSFSQILEQIVRIIVIMPLVSKYSAIGLEYSCAAILVGDVLAEAASCAYVYFAYKFDFKRLKIAPHTVQKAYRLLPVISHIALPISAGKYLNSLLRMIENILVPICLSEFSAASNGISLFGMIKGMALPILFFPSTLLGTLSTLLLPEISEASVCNRTGVVRSIVARIIKSCCILSIIFSGIFLVCGKNLGVLIYNDSDVGLLLCALSPIIPFMYLDAISDGILKGLDQQKFTFFTSVGDSAVRILLILLFLPRFGIKAFILIMYFSNFITGFLNTKKLIKASRVSFDLCGQFFIPVCCGFSLCLAMSFLLNVLGVSNLLFVVIIVAVCLPLYLVILYFLGIVNQDDINFIRKR